MGLIIICLDLYFLFYELVQIMRDVSYYFKQDIFNYIDLLTAALNLWLVVQTLSERETYGHTDRSEIKNCTSFAVILMYMKLFYWMNLFPSYSYYVRLIMATL